MAMTRGLVQMLTIGQVGTGPLVACVLLGAGPTDTEILFVRRRSNDAPQVGAMKSSILDGLITAQVHRREVIVEFGDESGEIASLAVPPA